MSLWLINSSERGKKTQKPKRLFQNGSLHRNYTQMITYFQSNLFEEHKQLRKQLSLMVQKKASPQSFLVIFLNVLFLHPFVKIGEYSTLLQMASNHIIFTAGVSLGGPLLYDQERSLVQCLDWAYLLFYRFSLYLLVSRNVMFTSFISSEVYISFKHF